MSRNGESAFRTTIAFSGSDLLRGLRSLLLSLVVDLSSLVEDYYDQFLLCFTQMLISA